MISTETSSVMQCKHILMITQINFNLWLRQIVIRTKWILKFQCSNDQPLRNSVAVVCDLNKEEGEILIGTWNRILESGRLINRGFMGQSGVSAYIRY